MNTADLVKDGWECEGEGLYHREMSDGKRVLQIEVINMHDDTGQMVITNQEDGAVLLDKSFDTFPQAVTAANDYAAGRWV
jgi:hypothetical protein